MPGFSPLLIHKDPSTGETWYEFDGVIHLGSPNATTREGTLDSVEWYTSYQALTSFIASYHFGFMPNGGINPANWSNVLELGVRTIASLTPPPAFPPFAQTDGDPMTFDDSANASLKLQTGKTGPQISATAGAQSRKILDGSGLSDFLSFVGAGISQIKFGAGLYTVSGLTGAGGIFGVNVPHGLGSVPNGALATILPGGGIVSNMLYEGIFGLDATNIQPNWKNDAGFTIGNSTMKIAWCAWV